ncbi:MAG: hypothetical protein MRZ79_06835 [Bacteroidia bacterium]|nr:hypothetical protein [Bacteroidia bacterium]
MNSLNPNWFLEGNLDFEYKKYVLLAYLQKVSQEFAQVKLYPSFSDLIFHYRNLQSFKENKDSISQKFPKELNKEEFKRMKLKMEETVADSEEIEEVDSIVSYAIPQIHHQLKQGKEIYQYIEEHLKIEPVGILPLYKREGYVLLQIPPAKEVDAYEYKIAFFENTDANYYGISFSLIGNFRHSIANTYENMKRSLIKDYKKYPNPATFLLLPERIFPAEEALIPVAKRKMLALLK